jgi:hypothetical protein
MVWHVAAMSGHHQFDAASRPVRQRCQLTISLTEALRTALEQRAREEHRTLSSQAHYFIVKALASEPRRGLKHE